LTPKQGWVWTDCARREYWAAPRSFVSRRVAPEAGDPKNAGRSGTINDDHEEESSMRPRTQVASENHPGMSSERLNRLTETFQRDVDAGEIPGAVVVVARNGKIAYEKAFGYQSREGNVSMKSDAIFRIASMSKPITSVAVMMLVEEGKIDLAAPVSQYLPEFSDLRVGVERAPLKRPMTVQDLLRHTSGLTYGNFTEDASVKQAYEEAKVFNFDQSLTDLNLYDRAR
jgi:CubicO group peptidase (beta-lactamase class C family)